MSEALHGWVLAAISVTTPEAGGGWKKEGRGQEGARGKRGWNGKVVDWV